MSQASPPSVETEAKRPASSPWLRPALELGPLLLFFLVYSKWNIYVATGVFMVTSVISLAVTRVRERRWPVMPLVTAILVLVLGGLTIWLHDDTFIKIKVTAVNALFGVALLVGLLLGKPLIKHVFGEALQLADRGWETLTKLWAGYFLTLAALNEVVWRNVSTDAWVSFKTFALPILSILFVIAQTPVIAKHDLSKREAGS